MKSPMRKRTAFLYLAALVAAVGMTATMGDRSVGVAGVAAARVSESFRPAVESKAVPEAVKIVPKKESIPAPAPRESEAELKREFTERGHSPQAVLDFGSDLAVTMLEAFESSSRAEEVFGDLENCALDQAFADPFRALCAANAKRLSLRFPAVLGDRYARAEAGLPEPYRRFLDRVQQ